MVDDREDGVEGDQSNNDDDDRWKCLE